MPYLIAREPLPLYQFQRAGVARLLKSRRLLLADDMGLGKTLQTAAALTTLVGCGRVRNALVLAPATLVPNWLDELAKWTPELVVMRGGPAKQSNKHTWRSVMTQCHVLVTNYEDVRDLVVTEAAPQVDLLVLDEAHRIKNWESLTSRATRRIGAQRIWALTGTPLERDTEDLVNLLAFLDRDAFTRTDASLPKSVLRARAARMMLRREKADVVAELPPVVIRHERLALLGPQAEAYRRALASQGDNTLADFGRLRTLCDYDAESGMSVKIDRIVDLVSHVGTVGEKAVVFSYLLEPLRLLATRLRMLGIGFRILDGSMNSQEREAAIRDFKGGDAVVLLASMRVASEGLTLVEANHVAFVNRWWNPSLNNQARDRVVRIGQKRTVFVHSFTLEGTIEEDLDDILETKEELFDTLIASFSRSGGKVTEALVRSRLASRTPETGY
ncbi:MAG: DEAD/DEAH box helicase [Gemmatimonadetes bacterium]|nr:DEAD/DEAH box helicase [Gemmatimonadota bacterium]